MSNLATALAQIVNALQDRIVTAKDFSVDRCEDGVTALVQVLHDDDSFDVQIEWPGETAAMTALVAAELTLRLRAAT